MKSPPLAGDIPEAMSATQSERRGCAPCHRNGQIAEYSRLTLGLPRHGTCEQMPLFCAAA